MDPRHDYYNNLELDDMLQTEEYESVGDQKQSVAHAKTSLPLSSPSKYASTTHFQAETTEPGRGHQLRRFYFRSLVGILAPLIITGYFVAIWRIYLAPQDPRNPLVFGPPGATWVYYSWFIAGIIGLNLSLYGLAGVEASMLMDPIWEVHDAMMLMMHADATWSGPGGWMKTIKRLVRFHHKGGDTKLPSRLWFILAIPSILVFIAWPLSGLAFETTSGFIRGTPTDEGPTMTGFSYSNFNERAGGDVLNGASLTWQYALDARVPGQGTVYTPEGVDRSRHAFLQKLPVVLPKDDGVSRIFLSAQAENPIEGKSWGVLLEYNCSIIERGSQLTVLNYRNATKAQDTLLRGFTSVFGYQAQNDSFIMIANETDPLQASWVSNMHAVIEVGYQKWPNASALERLQEEDSNAQFTKTQSCYFNQAENVTGDYPSVDQQTVFEVLLWQILFNSSYSEKAPDYNFTVDHNITDLYGAYDYRDFNYIIAKNDTRFSGQPMTAVGARCTSSSSVGTADIDGAHSTYSNFVRTDTPINVQINRCANRFGAEAIASIVTPGTGTEEWLSKFFTSAAAPPTFYAAFTDDPTSIDAGTGTPLQLSYLQAEQLRRSLLGAHAGYATQLMYNGGQGFTALDGSHVTFNNPNVTEYVAGTVLKLGTIPASVPASLFFAWAFVGPILGIIYGFRRRWSATLDGYSLFRLGADLPDDVKERMAMYTNTGEREECFELNRLPGLVGDTKPGQWLGHIGLVEGSVAAKDKKYQ